MTGRCVLNPIDDPNRHSARVSDQAWLQDRRNGQAKFVDTVASMTVNAVKLGTAITAASASVTAGVAKIASGLESLHFASQRTRASVENIQAFGFAAAQMGGSAEGARASLEHLARLMRTNPGASGLLRRLGV